MIFALPNNLIWHQNRAESQEMCLFKALKACCVNLCWTSFLGVLRGVESKSAEMPHMPQKWEIQDGHQK